MRRVISDRETEKRKRTTKEKEEVIVFVDSFRFKKYFYLNSSIIIIGKVYISAVNYNVLCL